MLNLEHLLSFKQTNKKQQQQQQFFFNYLCVLWAVSSDCMINISKFPLLFTSFVFVNI